MTNPIYKEEEKAYDVLWVGCWEECERKKYQPLRDSHPKNEILDF